MSGFPEYGQYDALGLAELVRAREVSPLELVEEAIRRIETVNPLINCVIHRMYEHARSLATGELPDGPFRGVPFLLKDLLASYRGQPMSFGSASMRHYVADHDSALVARFKQSGVITVGKTNLSELGLSPMTEPKAFGPTRNPWELTRTPSGSSGGAGASVAARVVPMASGGDGGGSIRTPASACGVFGLKPSRGRNPAGPDMGEVWHGAVAEHVLTRSVRDSAAMLDATAGPDCGCLYFTPAPAQPFVEAAKRDPERLRIAFTTESLLGSQVDRECVEGVERTATLLRELGHEVVAARPRFDRRTFLRAYITVVAAETAVDLREMAALLGKKKLPAREVELETRVMALLGRSIDAPRFLQACRDLHRINRILGAFLEEYDVFLSPALAKPPVAIGALSPSPVEQLALRLMERLDAGRVLDAIGVIDTLADKVFAFSAFCAPFNVSGQPAMSMPLHWTRDGLPVGMHFAGRYADETTLFQLAGQLERARPWAERKPPICAD